MVFKLKPKRRNASVAVRPPLTKPNTKKMSTSHYSSRPAQSDIGSGTIRIPLENTRRHTRQRAGLWLAVGVVPLLCDGLALAHFANDAVEAVILGGLTIPMGVLVTIAGWEARK